MAAHLIFICRGLFRRFAPLLFTALFAFQAVAATNLNVRLISNVRPQTNSISYGDVWAEGDIACLGVWLSYSTYHYGVGIYSISNPAAPVLLGTYSPSPESNNQFELGAVRNQIGYFGSWSGGGLHIVSLTNPAAPTLLCRVGATTGNVTNGFNDVHTLWLERNYLYEAAHDPGIVTVKVFDVNNPSLPVYLQDITTTNTTKVHQITVRTKGAKTILYTSGWGGNDNGNPSSPGQTDIWDVSNVGTQPAQWLGRIYSGYNSHSSYPTPDGNTLVVCRETPGGDVKLYDVSNPGAIPANPVPLVTLTPASMGIENDIPHNPVVVSNYLFLSWYQNGIQIFDITDRTKPVRLGFYDTFPGTATSSYQRNWAVFPYLGFDKVLLSDIQSGLYVMDFSAAIVPTNNYPPLIASPPPSITATQGTIATLSAAVTGSDPHYQWLFNGSPIPGANTTQLVFNGIQPTNAGAYNLVVSNATATITSAVASVSVITYQPTEEVFFESFDSPSSSGNWNIFQGSANNISDYDTDFNYDYSTYFSDYNGAFIPPAPHSTNGTTRGLRLTVNKNDSNGATAGVSLYPKNVSFSGPHTLKADMWINYNGPSGGGAGSTEHATFGINHDGTRVNWASSTTSDGIWFAVDGEGGDPSKDYRGYVGSSSASPQLFFSANNNSFISLFPTPPYESAGAPGKSWAEVEVSVDANNLVTWRLNGTVIDQWPNTSTYTNGTIMLGYMDLFSGISGSPDDSFVLFDNVRVEVPMPLPAIVTQPQTVSVYPLQDATFSVAATGAGPLSFQWRFNGVDILGATNNSFTRSQARAQDVGIYSVAVSNPAGVVASANVSLLLLDSPYLSAVTATPGDHAAIISWRSIVPAASEVHFEAGSGGNGSGFNQSSYVDATPATNHAVMLTGLSPATLYSFQVLSASGTNTYISGVYQFQTLPEQPPGSGPPAWWQNFYFGGATDTSADPDGDGFTTAQEYVLGTNPTNASSKLSLTGEAGTNAIRVTFWPALSDRAYQLLGTSDLGGPDWNLLSDAASSTGDGHGVFTLPTTNAPAGFYRLRVTPGSGGEQTSFVIQAKKAYSSYASDPICGPNRAYVR